jgi:hypothetical protein
MDSYSYLPASLSEFFTWPPIRRDLEERPQSKTDRIVTIAIVCGISALFLIPLVWYIVARIIRIRRSRARAKDAEQGVAMS